MPYRDDELIDDNSYRRRLADFLATVPPAEPSGHIPRGYVKSPTDWAGYRIGAAEQLRRERAGKLRQQLGAPGRGGLGGAAETAMAGIPESDYSGLPPRLQKTLKTHYAIQRIGMKENVRYRAGLAAMNAEIQARQQAEVTRREELQQAGAMERTEATQAGAMERTQVQQIGAATRTGATITAQGERQASQQRFDADQQVKREGFQRSLQEYREGNLDRRSTVAAAQTRLNQIGTALVRLQTERGRFLAYDSDFDTTEVDTRIADLKRDRFDAQGYMEGLSGFRPKTLPKDKTKLELGRFYRTDSGDVIQWIGKGKWRRWVP